MRVYRLSRKKYTNALSGKGASQSNNRWNSKGTEVIYTAESRALALAEVAVHLSFATLPSDFVMMEIEISDDCHIAILDTSSLSKDWNAFPSPLSTMKLGDKFIESKSALALKVPSAVVAGDFNYLINPHHPDLNKIGLINISPFPIDGRLFKIDL
ncbi:MAG: RES domain-containing protein [Bacteroidia bacterium]|jgi:RES domain-containing protein